MQKEKNCWKAEKIAKRKKNYYSKLSPMMKSLLMAENQFIAVLMQRSKTLVLMHILRLWLKFHFNDFSKYIVLLTFRSLSSSNCRTRNSANGVTKWITADSNARNSSATRSRDAANRRRERNVAARHPVNTAPAASGRRARRPASYSWALCE